MGPHLWYVTVLCPNSTNTILSTCQMGVKGRNNCWNEKTSAFNCSIWKNIGNKTKRGRGRQTAVTSVQYTQGTRMNRPTVLTGQHTPTSKLLPFLGKDVLEVALAMRRVFGSVYTLCSLRNKSPLWASTNYLELSQLAGTQIKSSLLSSYLSTFTCYM